MFGKKTDMSDTEKQAKLNVLKKIREEMENAMKSGLGNSVKKVTVASDSEEGLEEGLDKAKDIIEDKEEDESEETTPFAGEETPEEELEEHEMLEDALEEDEFEDEESIDAEIERLLAKKKELQSL